MNNIFIFILLIIFCQKIDSKGKKKDKALESLGEEKRMAIEYFKRKGRSYERLAKKTIVVTRRMPILYLFLM